MLNRKSLLATAMLMPTFLPTVSQAEVYDARSFGRGMTGLTLGEYNQAALNPALINKSDDDDDFSFALNAGALVSDEDGFVDGAEDVRDDIKALFGTNNAAQAADINQRMQGYDKATGQVDAGASVFIGLPNKTLPAALVVRSKVTAGIAFDYDAADAAVLQSIAAGTATDNDLKSRASTSAIGLAEVGVVLGHSFGNLETGVTLKAQRIELFEYSATVASFDEDDITDSQSRSEHNNLNVDVGANYRLGNIVVSGVVDNLIPKTFEGPTPIAGSKSEYEMKPVAVAGVGYAGSLIKAEVNADLTVREGFDRIKETQFVRAGVELSAGQHFHIRAGYRADTKDNVTDIVTAGIGITPFDRFNIDLSAAKGKGESVGGALQIGFKI